MWYGSSIIRLIEFILTRHKWTGQIRIDFFPSLATEVVHFWFKGRYLLDQSQRKEPRRFECLVNTWRIRKKGFLIRNVNCFIKRTLNIVLQNISVFYACYEYHLPKWVYFCAEEVGLRLANFCTTIPLYLLLHEEINVSSSNYNEKYVGFLSVTKGKCISPVTSMVDSLKGKEKVYFTLYSLKEASLGKLCIKLEEECADLSCYGLYCHLITTYTEISVNPL